MSDSSSSAREARPVRVSAERVFELARHLTERDREIAMVLFEQQVLTTDQLTLLFFSSRRRAQDRLLFLYRHRVVDRFYPPAPFGLGKPQAHWLLDEAGAILVAARLGVERKKLGWQRRDDWGSHPQLAHRLETNRFVTDLITATLTDPTLGVMWWTGPAQASRRLDIHPHVPTPRPDGGFELVCAGGQVECHLEWDRATEAKQQLRRKLRAYMQVCEVWGYSEWPPLNLLIVVPHAARLAALEEVVAGLREDTKFPFFTAWDVYAATADDLARQGPLGHLWAPLTDRGPVRALTDLRPRGDAADAAGALGRRWRHDRPDFWPQLSPLGRAADAEVREVAEVVEKARDSAQPCGANVANGPTPTTDTDQAEMRRPTAEEGSLARRRAELEEELRADIGAARARRGGTAAADLRPSEIAGYMDDPEPDEEGSWR
jgi:Replication-relaxation